MAAVFRNPDLRRIQLAWCGSIIGTWAYSVALAVYAYGQGGATAVGLVGILRFATSGIAAPLLGPLSDRFPRRDVMLAADVVRAAAMAAAAVVITVDGPAGFVYAFATLTSASGMPFRPAEKALLPALAKTPEELVSSNIASSTIESLGFLVGPALGAALLAAWNAEVVFAVNGLSFVLSALLLIPLPRLHPEKTPSPEAEAEALPRGSRVAGAVHHLSGGFRALLGHPDLRTLTALYCAQTLVAGAETVLLVSIGLDLLDIGESGVGALAAATGVGGLMGAFATLALTGNRRLASIFGVGVLLWGLPFVLVAAFPSVATAVLALVIIGLANTVVDVAALTVMQRIVPDHVLGRAFGVMDGMLYGSIGIGAAITPLLINGPGTRAALLVWGIFPTVAVALAWPKLRSMDAREGAPTPLRLFERVPFLAPLPARVLESLAANAGERRADAGEVLMTSGDPGDLFYAIESGEVDVLTASGDEVRLGPGGFFGEIALIHDVPRNATVRARTDAVLRTLERDEFVSAVTGHPASAEAAAHVMSERSMAGGGSLSLAS